MSTIVNDWRMAARSSRCSADKARAARTSTRATRSTSGSAEVPAGPQALGGASRRCVPRRSRTAAS